MMVHLPPKIYIPLVSLSILIGISTVHAGVKKRPDEDKALAKAIHKISKEILTTLYNERHSEYMENAQLPAPVKAQIRDAMKYQTVALGVNKNTKKIIVAGNVYTNVYNPDGTSTAKDYGFQKTEIPTIVSIVRGANSGFKCFEITVIKPDINSIEQFRGFLAGSKVSPPKSKWAKDNRDKEIKKAIKAMKGKLRVTKLTKEQNAAAVSQGIANSETLQPQKKLLEKWNTMEQMAYQKADAARAFHAEIQILTYLEYNLGLDKPQRAKFIIQASKPYCAKCKAVVDKKGESHSGGFDQGRGNPDPVNWGRGTVNVVGIAKAEVNWKPSRCVLRFPL